MNRLPKTYLIWSASWIGCVLLTSLSFAYFDLPVAEIFSSNLGRLDDLTSDLGAKVLLSIEAAIALYFCAIRLACGPGKLSPLSKNLTLASVTSICAYGINDRVLKFFFGVSNPANVLAHDMQHTFHFFAGNPTSSFPSGHMILAGSFAGVFMRLYPPLFWPFVALLFIAGAALAVGDWHFLSDVVAGSFFGISVGFLAGKLWQEHCRRGHIEV